MLRCSNTDNVTQTNILTRIQRNALGTFEGKNYTAQGKQRRDQAALVRIYSRWSRRTK